MAVEGRLLDCFGPHGELFLTYPCILRYSILHFLSFNSVGMGLARVSRTLSPGMFCELVFEILAFCLYLYPVFKVKHTCKIKGGMGPGIIVGLREHSRK